MSLKELIEDRLTQALAPTELVVTDESEQHRGHGGWREGGETHFRVHVVSPHFAGKSRVAMHREVNALLDEAFARGLHALAIEARAG